MISERRAKACPACAVLLLCDADIADVGRDMKLIGLEFSKRCAASASIFGDVTKWASVRRPEPLFILRSSHHFSIRRCLADRLVGDPYLLTHSGTMTKCLIRDTRCGSVGGKSASLTRSPSGRRITFRI